ncbi:unnamed protein product [Plutella xylostella]|uniref:(diamondback moth) hypothetical protein n=1 Tax=Plutella xylostella TaxID=51655 RepID=A0A8S4D6K2_PLUXY|nr:unnamed protein product [Plutella xylostella]
MDDAKAYTESGWRPYRCPPLSSEFNYRLQKDDDQSFVNLLEKYENQPCQCSSYVNSVDIDRSQIPTNIRLHTYNHEIHEIQKILWRVQYRGGAPATRAAAAGASITVTLHHNILRTIKLTEITSLD